MDDALQIGFLILLGVCEMKFFDRMHRFEVIEVLKFNMAEK